MDVRMVLLDTLHTWDILIVRLSVHVHRSGDYQSMYTGSWEILIGRLSVHVHRFVGHSHRETLSPCTPVRGTF